MILEVATLPVKAGQEVQFEQAFADAQRLIASIPGYLSHELLRGVDDEVTYHPVPTVFHYRTAVGGL